MAGQTQFLTSCGRQGGASPVMEKCLQNIILFSGSSGKCGGAVASWLVRWIPDRAVRVQAPVGDILLRMNWVPANLLLGVTLRWLAFHPGGVEILRVASC